MRAAANKENNMTEKQRGGTLLGLILGGLVGLGVALAVAVYITKTPVPFNTKSLTGGPDSDAAETMKNKDWDPNASLAGKNPAKPRALAASEAAATDPAAPASAPASAPAVLKAVPASAPAAAAASSPRAGSGDPLGDLARAVTAPAPAKARPASSADPIGDLAKSVTARPAQPAAAAKSPSGNAPGDQASPAAIPALPATKARPAELMSATQAADPFHYFVQAGAFRTEEEAAKQRARLQSLGIHAQVSEREQAGRTVYRVRLGPFDRKDEAEKMTDKLGDNAIDATLVRVQR
jgi:cell division protein FtsN